MLAGMTQLARVDLVESRVGTFWKHYSRLKQCPPEKEGAQSQPGPTTEGSTKPTQANSSVA